MSFDKVLIEACKNKDINFKQIKQCLSNGANVNCLDEMGNTPLQILFNQLDERFLGRDNKIKVIELLLKKHANPNLKNKYKEPLLHVACQIPHLKLIKQLLNAGAQIDALDAHNNTALHIACNQTEIEILNHKM